MRLVRFDDVAPIEFKGADGFRGGDIRFRDLLAGTEGTPGNYGLQWVEVDDAFATPRHRHAFEQVRILLEGEFGFGPGQVQKAGTVGYFCEGTYYTQDAKGRSVTLLLQVGGPTGQGFMSRPQLKAGIAALSARGSFHDGVYTWHDAAGVRHNQDSFEAVWEHVHGQAIRYPKPQFDAPVMMTPERFDWRPDPRAPGASLRRMARFHGQGLEIAQLRLDAGARWTLDARDQPWLAFCAEGTGRTEAGDWLARTSIEVARGEAATLHAATASTFWLLGLPTFDEAGPADDAARAAADAAVTA
ncbi:MAG: hypothetical protein WCK28_18005 [Burkholderiales bacterium]